MNSDSLFPFHGHNLPAATVLLAGIAFLFLVFKAGKLVTKVVLFLIAAACFAGAYWWVTHIRN
jgi:energy-coupling factor transporter transmembrane protein EcfT